jgi:hypothetical protein
VTADDVVGWVLLGAIAGAARSGSSAVLTVAGRFAAAALFLVFAFIVGQRLVDAALRAIARSWHGTEEEQDRASNERIAGRMVSPFVDGLFAASPVPVLRIRRGVMLAQGDVPHFERVLVPAIATLPGRAAQDVAF